MSENYNDSTAPDEFIPNILDSEEYYDYVASLGSKAEQMYQVARSLVANGYAILPCRPYNAQRFADESLPLAERKKASGKSPFKPKPYDNLCRTLAQVEDWWHPETGEFIGQNVGIATGECSNLLAVDVDVDPKEGVDGWASITPYLPIATVKVRSGGKSVGGQHLYFKYVEGFANSVSKLHGIDIRTNKGHIMAPLCKCQGVYEVVEWGEVAELPEDLHEALTAGKRANVSALPGADKDIDKQERPAAPIMLIRDALEYLPIELFDGVGLWLKIAMCIHSEHPDENGWQLLDEWSRGDLDPYGTGTPGTYDDKGNRLRWDSFSQHQNDLTVGTLFMAAKTGELDGYDVGGGWIDPRSGAIKVGPGHAVMMMRRSYVIVNPSAWKQQRANKPWANDGETPMIRVPSGVIFSTGIPLSLDNHKFKGRREVPEEMKFETLGDLTAHFQVSMGLNEKGVEKFKPLVLVWRQSPAKTFVRGIGYYVSREAPRGFLNLFVGWGVEPKKSNNPCEMFRKHVLEILCDGDEEKYSWIMNRLAWVAQRGEINIPTALVINGAEGLGKGIWWSYLVKAFGAHNCHYTTDPETFTGRFTGEELAGKFLVNADEALFSGDIKADGKAKGLIGNAQMREEGKGKATKVGQNVSFFIFFSNHKDPVQVARGNRRFTIMTGSDKYSEAGKEANPTIRKEADNHFKRLAEERDGDGPAQLMDMLLNWNIDETLAKSALMTTEKVETIQRQDIKRESIVEWVLNTLESEPTDDSGRWNVDVKAGKLYEEYNEWVKNNKHNHPSRGWVALSVQDFKKAITGINPKEYDFGFEAKRKTDGNYYRWPKRDKLVELVMAKYPGAVSYTAPDYDASKEEDF